MAAETGIAEDAVSLGQGASPAAGSAVRRAGGIDLVLADGDQRALQHLSDMAKAEIVVTSPMAW
ncbi:hypothetical protein ACWEQW_01545 [Streptomyces nigra]